MRPIVVVLVLLVVGCASNSASLRRAQMLEPGASKADVRRRLGEPGDRQFSGRQEAWQYCSTDYSGLGADDFRVVWFMDGAVSGITSYKSRILGSCEDNFRSIRWEEAPTASIEIRER
jgi:hypothetical protein